MEYLYISKSKFGCRQQETNHICKLKMSLLFNGLLNTLCLFYLPGMSVQHYFVGSTEAPLKAFLLFFLLPDWLKLNHLKSRMECGFSDIFSRHICSTVAETIGVTNYAASFGANKCSENHIWSCWDDARSVEPTNCFSHDLFVLA